jgi:glycosyltransferase involved in cell wall biosynthesis
VFSDSLLELRVALEQSLSVVLPVYNAQQSLTEKVHKLLDILPDLTHRFEILIVDDGSVDQTAEVAHELSREYPQVQMIQHNSRLGWPGVIETALRSTWGEVLFVQDEGTEIDSSQFQRLWALRVRENLYPPSNAGGPKPTLMKRLAAWGVRLEEANQLNTPSGLQMLRREGNLRDGNPPDRDTGRNIPGGKPTRISRTDGPQHAPSAAGKSPVRAPRKANKI